MTWNTEQLALVARTDEVEISSTRPDGSLRPFVTIWAVSASGSVFVRSAHGPEGGWFRRAATSGTGQIVVGHQRFDVDFTLPDTDDQSAVDAAYASEYAHYPSIVRGMIGPDLYPVTLRLDLQS